MSTTIAEAYEAFKEAGASEEKSKAAAMAVADHSRFDRMERDVGVIKSEVSDVKSETVVVKSDLAVVKAELAMVKWIVSGVGLGVVDEGLRKSLVFHVARDRDGLAAGLLDFRDERVQLRLAPRGGDDFRAFPREELRGRISNAGTRARNDGDLVRERAHLKLHICRN